MLRELHIRNYAIIDALSLPLSGGFNVITGETGAGKSILVDAISLILGERSSTEVIRQGAKEAILEAAFDPPVPPERALASERVLDPDPLIFKRILSRSGKNRAYLDGSIASLASLKASGQNLIEIHGQQGQQSLNDLNWQRSLLDAFGRLSLTITKYQAAYQRWSARCSERDALRQEIAVSRKEGAEKEIQLSELKSANLSRGEEVRLEKEECALKNWETLHASVQGAYSQLSEEGGILSQLDQIGEEIQRVNAITKDADPERALWDQSRIQLKELSAALRARIGEGSFDPERLEALSERLYLIQQLKRKYKCSLDELIDYQESLESDLSHVSGNTFRLQEIDLKCQSLEKKLLEMATELSRQRTKSRKILSKRVQEELAGLGMEKTIFDISQRETRLTEEGMDEIAFQISLPGERPQSLAHIASGGELSRIMLALKVVLAGVDPVPTLVFDEIDAGIGGGIAERVGKRLLSLSNQHQVLCITHLPQIASLADTHYFVEKKSEGARVVTSIRELDPKERVEELARMLGGITITPLTRSHAAEMIQAKHTLS